MALDGNLAVVGGPAGFSVYDVSNPASPSLVSSRTTAGPVRRIRLSGRLALVSQTGADVEAWSLAVPSNPVMVARYPAQRADDMVLAGGYVVVADSLLGLLVFPMPDEAVPPSARIVAPATVSEAAAGQRVFVEASASGARMDDLELLVNGEPWVRLGGASSSRPTWTVPASAVMGDSFTLSLRARGAGGTQSVSPVHVIKARAVEVAAPTVSYFYPSSSTGTWLSGFPLELDVRGAGGVPPYTLRMRLGTLSLGTLAPTTGDPLRFVGTVRMPVVAETLTAPLTAELYDGAGRMAQVSQTAIVKPDVNAPTEPRGLPTVVRAGPTINTVSISSTDDGAFSLRLLVNSVEVGSVLGGFHYGGASLTHRLLLPENSEGSSLTLTAIAEDGAGRTSTVTKTYVVKPDGEPPVIAFPRGDQPSASAFESQTIPVYVTASDPDYDLASFTLYANGDKVGESSNGAISITYEMPVLSARTYVDFKAVATDVRGRVTEVTRRVLVDSNVAPNVSVSSTQNTPLQGERVRLCARATHAVSVTALTASANGTPFTGSPKSCNTSPCELCTDYTVPSTATQLAVEVAATDFFGVTANKLQTYTVNVNNKPGVSMTLPTHFIQNMPVELLGTVTDERRLAWAEFRVNDVVVGT
ncbi:MAG TPA: hypothetical protein VEU33_22380, partial [Archangium sp.]|nr:hypothetical protein [Archangium sp.]